MREEMASENPSTTILSLPVELQQEIISKTDKRDVLAIRLTCRELSAAADDHFLVTFYSERKHLLTRHGIQALISISEDIRLRSKLEKIEIVAADVTEMISPSYISPLDRAVIGTPPPKRRPAGGTVLQRTNEQKRKDEERRREEKKRRKAVQAIVWERWVAERDAMLSDELIISLLSTAFRNLSAMGRQISLQVSRDTDVPDFAVGCQQLTRTLTGLPMKKGFTVPYLNHCKNLDSPLETILRAVMVAKLPLSELCIGDGIFDPEEKARSTLAPFSLAHPNDTWPSSCVQNLRSITLPLDCYLGRGGDMEGLAGFTKFVQAAKGLETVVMEFDYHGEAGAECRYLSAIGNAFSKNKLRELFIREMSFSTQELEQFLSQQRDSLRTLELDSVAIPEPERWQDIFLWMSSELNLNNLIVSSLYHRASDGCSDRDELIGLVGSRYLIPRHSFMDSDAVVAGLRNLAQNAKFRSLDDHWWGYESDDTQAEASDAEQLIEE